MKNIYSGTLSIDRGAILKFGLFGAVLALALFYAMPQKAFATTAPSFDATQSVANVSVTNDQTVASTTNQANVAQTKATVTLTINAVVASSSPAKTITIGTCVVTFATTTAGTGRVNNLTLTADESNCSDNTAVILLATTSGDIPLTTTQIMQEVRGLTNVSDTGHGALAITSTSTSNAIFTTSGTESSATAVTFTDNTAGKITSTWSVTGIIPVAQVQTVTITGTVDTGDVYTLRSNTFVATYTVLSSDTTTTNIASGLNTAIQAASGYGSTAFTSAASTNTVVLTASTAGTGFTNSTSTAANGSNVAQVVVFTPTDVTSHYRWTITLNGTDYTETSNSSATKLTDLLTALADDLTGLSFATCTSNGSTAITCTASVAGTGFSYDAAVTHINTGGSSGGGSSVYKSNPATPAIPGVSPAIPSSNAKGYWFVRPLHQGLSGEDVTALQNKLVAEGVYSGPITGFFGQLTAAAVKLYQAKHGIDQVGYIGPMTLVSLNSDGQGVTSTNPGMNDADKQAKIASIKSQLASLLQLLIQAMQKQGGAQ